MQADGEIGLKVKSSERYFGVINIGDVEALKKLLREYDIQVKPDHFTPPLFTEIDTPDSPIRLLIGCLGWWMGRGAHAPCDG